MNKRWGWLIKENVAPVWIGERGASMASDAGKAWGQPLLDSMNGKAPGPLYPPAAPCRRDPDRHRLGSPLPARHYRPGERAGRAAPCWGVRGGVGVRVVRLAAEA